MNKIYKVIWSKVTQSFVVVSELASSQGKAKSSVVNQQSKLSSLLSICFQLSALAIPLFSTIQTASAVVAISSTSGSTISNSTATTKGTRNDSIAIGNNSNANGSGTIAIGVNSSAKTTEINDSSQGAVAIGAYSVADGNQSVALGDAAQALGAQSSAIGNNAYSTGFGSIVIGGDDTGSSANTTTDPYNYQNLQLNIGYLKNSGNNFRNSLASGVGSVVVGVHGQALSNGSTAIGVYATAGDNGVVTNNSSTSTTAIEATAVGAFARARDTHSTAIGYKASSFGENATAIGSLAETNGTNAVAIGSDTKASANDSIAIGTGDNVTGKMSGAIGGSTTVNANGSYSLGNSNTIKAGADNTFVVGNNVSSATNPNSVILGNGSSGNETVNSSSSATINTIAYSSFAGVGNQTKGYVSVGSKNNERQIKNVAAGEISATSTDAINGSQLYVVADTLSKKIPTVVAGANTNVASSSTTTGTTYTVNAYNTTATAGSTYVNVTEKVTGYNISYAIDLNQTTKDTIVTANTTAHAANATANKANTTANLANTTANTANGTANTANTTANMANTTANTANGTANVANTTANTANTTANNANGTANTANNTANVANKTANTANTTANTANTTANTANTTANAANTTANIANATVNKGWNITTSASDGSATNTTDENVQMGENVTIDAGQNINITQSGQKISIATSMTPTFTSATFGGTTINSDGLTITNGPSITTSGINASNKTITNLANGVNNSDAVNKGQLEVVNTTANAANTTANTANTTANTANTTANTANGTANTANTTANTANTTANAANTTANIANATVNKGWNITTSQSKGSATSTTNENVQMGETVTIDAGQNINITQNGQNISIATSMTPTFTSAKFGDTLIQNDGLTIVGGPSITKSGINAGSKTITNVADGVNATDAVNKGQLEVVNTTANAANTTANTANTTANAANTTANAANATVNKGWNITTSASAGGNVSGNNAQNIQMGDTVTIDAGQNINITQSGQNISIATSMTPTFTNATFGDTLIDSNGLTITAGPSITKSGVNAGNKNITNVATPIAGTDAANKDYVDNFTLTYKGDNNTNGSNKLTETVTFAGTDKQIVTTAENGKVSFKLADEVNASLSKADSALQSFTVGADNKGTNATINNTSTHFDIVGTPNYVNTTVNGQNITVDIAQSFKDTVTNNTQNISNNAQNITNNANNITNNTNNITNNTNNITKNTGDIANNTQNITKNATEIAKGFGLKAQDGQEITKALGEKVEVIGGNDNINTTVANDKIQVNLNNTLNLTNAGSVTVGNSTINDNGLNITNGTTTVSLTEKGLDNGNQTITNVANGTNGTDAVNKSQLDAVNATANAGWNFNTSGNATKTNVAPNNTVTFNGDKNVNVTHNGSTLNVSLNNTVDLGTSGSLKVNSTTINNNGTISGVTNGTLSTTSTEAVNGSQLFATNQNVTTNTDNIAKNTATIDKGMVYGGDTGNAFTLKLGDQANVKGGITDTAALTDNNLGVVSDGSNTLMVKLAKELTNLTSATFGSDTDKTVINKDGVTITNGTDTISLTENGLNNGNKTITNVANGTNSTDAVNKSQLDAVTTTANAGWKLQANGTNESTVAPNDTVSLNNTDKNIVISKETTDDNVTFNLAKDLTGLTSATFGDTSINNDGLTIKDGPNVTKSGIDAANTKITNVTNGTVDATSKDAVNGSQLYATNQNVTNLNTTVSKGLTFNTTDTSTEFNRKLGDTITINGGADASAATAAGNIKVKMDNGVISLDLLSNLTNLTSAVFTNATNNSTVTGDGITVTNGTNTTSLTVNGLDNGNNTITHVANGTNGTDAVNFDQLKAVNATANAGWNFNTSGNVTKTNVAPNNTVTFNGDSNINVTHNGSTLNVSLNNTVDLGTSGSLKVNSTTINSNGTISGVTNGTLNAISTEAVNGSQLFTTNQNVTNNANEIAKGTVYGGDTGTSFTRKLGEQANVKGGITDESKLSDNNLGVVSDNTNNTLMVKLAKELTNLTSATFGNDTTDKTVINKDGVTITNGTDTISLTENGLDNGNKTITNVKAGVNDTDAVNKAQLDAVTTTANAGWKLQANGTNESTVKPNDTVSLNNTDTNIVINKETTDDNVTFNLAKNLTGLTSATFGNTLINDNGLTINNGPSITKSGIDAANTKITNVTDGAVNATSKDAVNGSQLYATNQNISNVSSNVTNNTAEIAKGWNLTTSANGGAVSGNSTEQINMGETISFIAGKNVNLTQATNNITIATADNVTFTNVTLGDTTKTTDGLVTLTKEGLTVTNGTSTVNLTTSGLDNGNNKITNVANGTNGKDAVNKDQLDAVNATANAGWNFNTSGNVTTSNVAPNSTVTFNGDKNISVTHDGSTLNVSLNNSIDLGNSGSLKVNGTTINSNGTISGVTNGTLNATSTEAVNGSQLFATNQNVTNNTQNIANNTATINKGTVYGGDIGTNFTRQLGEQTNVKGGITDESKLSDNNLGVVSDNTNNTLMVKLAKELTNLTSATFGNDTTDKTVINKDGVTITNGTDTISLTENGLDNGNKTITNVKAGVNDTDAVNKAQLDAVTTTANAGWKLQANGTNESTVTPNETVSLNNTDNNIVISKDSSNDNVTFNLAKNLTDLTSAAFGGTSINDNGLTINGGPNITKSGIDAADKKITNVTNGTVDATSKDAVNGSQLYATNQNISNVSSNVSNNTAEIAKGWNLTTSANGGAVSGNTTEQINMGETISFIAGKNVNLTQATNNITIATADNVTFTNVTLGDTTKTTDGLVTLTKEGLTVTNGTSTVNLTTSGLDNGNNKITNVANGTNGKDAVNKDQLDAVNATANAGWNFNTSGNVTTSNVAPNSTVTFNGDKNISVTHDGSTLNVSLNNTVDLGTDGSLKVNSTTINSNGTISGVTNGTLAVDSTEAVNGSQLFATNQNVTNNTQNIANNTATINKGTVYGGDIGTNFTRKLGEQTNVKGGITDESKLSDNNLGVVSDNTNNTLMVKLAKDLNLTSDGSVTMGDTLLNSTGLTITNGPSVTNNGIQAGNKQITNVSSGLDGTALKDASGDTLKNVANIGDLQTVINNVTNASAGGGFGLTDDKGDKVTQDLGKTIALNGKDGITVTANTASDGLEIGLGNNVTIGSKDGVAGIVNVKDKDGDDTITLDAGNSTVNIGSNGAAGSIGLNGLDGTVGINGKDGTNASITVANGTKGIDGNDLASGANKTRIVYENANGSSEQVATLNDGLYFTGDNTTVNISKKLNETLTIKGNLSQTANVTDQNLRVDVVDNALVIKMAKELTNLTNATFGSGTDKTVIDKDGVTITNGTNTVSLTEKGLNNGNNTITNVSSGLVNNTDGSNVTLANATGDTLTNVVNVGDLKNSIHNITNASAGGGFGLTDDKGDKVTQDLGKTIALNGKDGITVTANATLGGLEVGLGNNVTIGGKDGTSGVVNVKDKDGDNAITLDAENATVSIGSDGLPGSIGLDGTNGTIGIIGKDGTNASITVTDGAKGLAGNDGLNGASKTRITYTKSDGTPEEVATLNDGLQFVGDDGKVITKKLNEQLSIKGNLSTTANVTDKNLRVDNENGELIIKMAKELRDLTNATFISGNSQSVLDGNGFTITSNVAGKNPVSLTDNGLNNGNNTITHVANGTNGTDAVNKNQLDAVNATANAGWNFNTSGNATTTNVAPNSTVTFNGDKNINVTHDGSNLNVSLNNTVDLGANGSMKIGNTTVDNNGLTVGNTTVTDNGLTIAGGPSVTQAGIDAGNKKLTGVLAGDISATSTDAINGAQIYQVEQNVKAAKTEVEAGNNVNVSTTTGKNGQTIYTVATASDVDFDKVTVGDVTISKNSGINAGNHQVANVANGSISADSKDAVNGSQLYATNQNVTNLEQEVSKGWNVTTGMVDGSTGTVTGNSTTKVAMGDTVSVKAGNNIAITQDGKNIAIATSMTPTFDSVTVGTKGNSAKIGTTTDNYGNAISVTGDDGVSPTRITNVAAGQADNDAVNVSQVRNMANHINSSINKVDKNLRAGIAGAMAAGNLYHVTLPGKSMVAAGAGVYKGEGAVAVGYSRLSDNGKIGIKFSVNSNTRGDTGAAASVGYQW